MAPPVYTDGQVLFAADCNSWFVPLAGYKTADLGRTTTTMAADPDLAVTAAANAIYFVDVVLSYRCASTTPNFKWTWVLPASASTSLYHAMYTGAGGGFVSELDLWSETHTAGCAIAATAYPVTIRGTLATAGTAGTFALSWAADSTAGAMTLTSRSHMKLTRTG